MNPGDLVWAHYGNDSRLAVLLNFNPQDPNLAEVRLMDGTDLTIYRSRLTLVPVSA